MTQSLLSCTCHETAGLFDWLRPHLKTHLTGAREAKPGDLVGVFQRARWKPASLVERAICRFLVIGPHGWPQSVGYADLPEDCRRSAAEIAMQLQCDGSYLDDLTEPSCDLAREELELIIMRDAVVIVVHPWHDSGQFALNAEGVTAETVDKILRIAIPAKGSTHALMHDWSDIVAATALAGKILKLRSKPDELIFKLSPKLPSQSW